MRTKDTVTFQRYKDTGNKKPSLFEGMPVGIEFLAKWHYANRLPTIADEVPIASGVAGSEGDAWTVTVTGTTPVAAIGTTDLWPPYMSVTLSANDNDSWEGQRTESVGSGENFRLATGKRRYFRCAFTISDTNNDIDAVTQCDLFLGFAVTDATVIDGATDFIGFHKADGSTTINFVAGKDASTSGALVDQIVASTGVSLTAAMAGVPGTGTVNTFEFVVEGTNTVHVYANGAYVRTVTSTTQLPDNENLCETIAFQQGEATVVKSLNVVQYLWAAEF